MREPLPESMRAIFEDAQKAFSSATDSAGLENAKALFLGKTGKVTELLKGMAQLSVEDKKTQGAAVNRLKEAIEEALQARRADLAEHALQLKLAAEALDVTKPGRVHQNANMGTASHAYAPGLGGLHPVTLTQNRIEHIFMTAGFEVADGPEIETDFHNFTALNTPAHHPARSMHDTFYVDGGRLLRTHTSPIQVRFMQTHKPPIRIIAPGRVYRVDSDATHSPMFHQLEGLWIEPGVCFADLKSCFIAFLQAFFETDALQVRFRPSFFPFTEPSAEIDLAFTHGPHQGRWLEVAGAGQVHPNVLQSVGIDAESFTGFAFGVGIERLAMLKYGVNDLRLFYENDLRFLQQFRAA